MFLLVQAYDPDFQHLGARPVCYRRPGVPRYRQRIDRISDHRGGGPKIILGDGIGARITFVTTPSGSVAQVRSACTMLSMRRCVAPRRRDSMVAMVDLPTPGRPPKTISIPCLTFSAKECQQAAQQLGGLLLGHPVSAILDHSALHIHRQAPQRLDDLQAPPP
jgi:hypothetical protein